MSADGPRRFQLLLAAGAAAWFATFAVFPDLLPYAGLRHYGVWFIDSFAILASNDAMARGLDPYASNPLDYFQRPHSYSHWWLHLHQLGLTRAHNLWIGFTLVFAFLVAAVSGLRPRSAREVCWFLAVLCCPPVLLAVNRANNDLVIFVLLAPLVPCLLDARPAVRLLAVGLVAVATGLKYYPAAAGLLLLAGADTTVREVRGRVALAVLSLAVVGLGLVGELPAILALVPKAKGLMTFGAANLPAALGFSGGAAAAFVVAIVAVVVGRFVRSRIFAGWAVAPADRAVWLGFILGAVLLTGCFFTGVSYAYRWVFALWLAPLLGRLPCDPGAPVAVRRLAAATAVLLVVALWADPLLSASLTAFAGQADPVTVRRAIGWYFNAEQICIWALFICLLGFLVHFAREGGRRLFGLTGGAKAHA